MGLRFSRIAAPESTPLRELLTHLEPGVYTAEDSKGRVWEVAVSYVNKKFVIKASTKSNTFYYENLDGNDLSTVKLQLHKHGSKMSVIFKEREKLKSRGVRLFSFNKSREWPAYAISPHKKTSNIEWGNWKHDFHVVALYLDENLNGSTFYVAAGEEGIAKITKRFSDDYFRIERLVYNYPIVVKNLP